jgi:hypothetical protein
VWQPLREIVEKLLIVYDWSESFVALNLLLKPMFDELFLKHFSDLALREMIICLGRFFTRSMKTANGIGSGVRL